MYLLTPGLPRPLPQVVDSDSLMFCPPNRWKIGIAVDARQKWQSRCQLQESNLFLPFQQVEDFEDLSLPLVQILMRDTSDTQISYCF